MDDSPGPAAPEPSERGLRKVRRIVLGKPKDIEDPGLFHALSLAAFLAWVGLGADGLSSSAYGPEEAFKNLGEHQYLAVFLALLTAFTVLVIAGTVANIAYGVTIFLSTMYLQQVRGLDPLTAGLAFLGPSAGAALGGGLASLGKRLHAAHFRAGVASARPDQSVVVQLFDDVSTPARHARHDEDRRIEWHL